MGNHVSIDSVPLDELVSFKPPAAAPPPLKYRSNVKLWRFYATDKPLQVKSAPIEPGFTGFDASESNVLVRLLYSWNDELNGEDHRQAAWRLLREHRGNLKGAADRLAHEHGEFRRLDGEYHLRGLAAAHGARRLEADDGLREPEFQFLICVLGEHLREDQLKAAEMSADFTSHAVVSFEKVGQLMRYINPMLHLRDHKQLGSIADHERRARELAGIDARHAPGADDVDMFGTGLFGRAERKFAELMEAEARRRMRKAARAEAKAAAARRRNYTFSPTGRAPRRGRRRLGGSK